MYHSDRLEDFFPIASEIQNSLHEQSCVVALQVAYLALSFDEIQPVVDFKSILANTKSTIKSDSLLMLLRICYRHMLAT